MSSADVKSPATGRAGEAAASPARFELHGISKRYGGVRALTDVDLTLQAGEVHCLCGQNGSGKSTLIKIMAGVEQADAGSRILIDGRPHAHLSPTTSRRLGVQVIYQDLSLFPNLTVAENIAIGQHLGRWHTIDRARMLRTAQTAMSGIGVDLDPQALVSGLGIAQRQLVAICRAMASDARLLIMDEPTASLTRHEVDALLALTTQLKERGVAIMFVSHRLDEVMEVAERVTVLRDGVSQGCFDARDMDDRRLTMLMTGREFHHTPRQVDHDGAPVVLEARGLGRAGEYADVDLQVRAGEVLGITGLLGAGRTELALSLFGMTRPDRGEIRVDGQVVSMASNRDAIRHGIAYLAEDRLSHGLVVAESIGANIVVSVLDTLKNGLGLLGARQTAAAVAHGVAELNIKTANPDLPVTTLSGGNQQRVVLAKWLATRPRVLILDSPTVGVDVAAKDGIYEVIRGLAAQGMAVILISDEIPEVLHHCDRILVMRAGRLAHAFRSTEVSAQNLHEAVHG